MYRLPMPSRLIAAACAAAVAACSPQDATQPTEALLDPPTTQLTLDPPAMLATTATSGLPEFPGPDGFVRVVSHPYFPLHPGTRFVYHGKDGQDPLRDVIDVTSREKTILGVKVTVVLDRVYTNGELVEKTLDYFAQDKEGNVWYLGEDTEEYENGKLVSTAGSFQAGKDGAKAGIIMRVQPKVGETTQQEFAPGVAEDQGTVVSLDETVVTPFKTFHHCIKTRDFTPLEPGALEVKFYCRGVGVARGRDVTGGNVSMALTRVEP